MANQVSVSGNTDSILPEEAFRRVAKGGFQGEALGLDEHICCSRFLHETPHFVETASNGPFSFTALLCSREIERMRGRVSPASQYNPNGGNPLMVSPLHDLNTVDSRNGDMDGIVEGDRSGHATDSLEHDEDTDSADCVPQSYDHSLQLQGVGVEADHSLPLDSDEAPASPYGVLTAADVIPIEAARSRFLQILLSNFITAHVTPNSETPEMAYTGTSNNGKDKLKKRKTRDIQFEGDPKYVLPLAYVANLYETLVNEINARLTIIDNLHEKTMGVALEAAGGLYRRLVKLYPKSGAPCNFRRREMASALEARNRFPHLISGEEKRVRFVVVHGLELVERPNMPYDDAEWFKRLTGRHEAAMSERDYKFFAPRHKYRRALQNPLNIVPTLPPQSHMHHQPHTVECHQEHQPHPSTAHQLAHLSHSEHSPHHGAHLTDGLHMQHASPATQHIPQGMLPSSGLHGGRIMVLPPQPAKYCDECGAPYLRETSKYCSECGTKRLVLNGQSL